MSSRYSSTFRSAIVASLTIALLFLCANLVRASDQDAVEPASRQAMMAAIRKLALQVDQSQFDRDALLERLDYDDHKIIEFVTRDIGFEQYVGLLRGANGTLRARAGNALDQAVLLAGLLKDAGFSARIVRGELSFKEAQKLTERIFAIKPAAVSPYSNPAAAERIAKEAGFDSTVPASFIPVTAVGNFRQYATRLISELEAAKLDYGSGIVSDAQLVEQARDYFWVQYNEDGQWRSLHPAWGANAEAAPSAEPMAHFAEAIPDELIHKVSIQAFIERKRGNKIESIPVSDPWERPAANLVGLSITYSNFPLSLSAADFEDPAAMAQAIEESDLFFPMLNGAIAPGAQSFDLDGNVVPPTEAASMYAGVFKQLSKKTGKASSAIAALGSHEKTISPPAMLRTEAQWLLIKLTAPDGKVRSIRRNVAARTKGGRPFASAVAREVTLEVQTGTSSTGFLLTLSLEQLLATDAYLHQLRNPSDHGELGGNREPATYPTARLETRLYFALADAAAAAFEGRRVYRSLPAVVARYQPLYQVSPELDGLDVISDFHRIISVDPSAPKAIVADRVAFGIWQTAIEASVVSWGRSGTRNAFLDLRADKSAVPSIAVVVYSNSEPAVPADETTRNGHASWWQVDPHTGETLGMIAGGWGGAAPIVASAVAVPEYLIDTMAVLTKTIGGAKAGRALAICGGIVATLNLAKVGGTAGGLFDGEIIFALPPEIQALVAAAAIILQGAQMAGGEVAFMKWCVPKVAFGLP